MPGSEYYSRLRNIRSPSLFMVNEPGLPSLFWLGMVALMTLVLPGICGVKGVNFTFNGFTGISDVYIVPNSGTWTYNPNDSSIFLDPTTFCTVCQSVAGRFLYPQLVQMKDPITKTAKSFSTNFIYQIYIQDGNLSARGSGMTFMMVPNNITLGAPQDYLGLLTTTTTETNKNYQSDNHTFGVELDTHENPEFADPSGNHIGIDLASMNSTATFIPTFTLATASPDLYQQAWIDYFKADSHMDIYITQYGHDKPTTPLFTIPSLDLSFLNEYMFIGFSAAVGLESSNLHKILAWSFSTDDLAPSICIATDAPPAPPSPSAITLSSPPRPRPVWLMLILSFGIVFGGVILLICCWKTYRVFAHPILFFLAHSSGEDETTKNFVESLSNHMKSTWRYKFHLIRVFFDRDSLPIGENFPEGINRKLEETRVGVVIVTKDFFTRKWPMTELVSFVDSNRRNQHKMQILPLFYRLNASKVNYMLRQNTWEHAWENMSIGDHPISVQKCREAVRIMCEVNGIEYNYATLGHDRDYIERILNEVSKLCNKMVMWS